MRDRAATIFLVRHAAHDQVDSILCGRMAGVSLGAAGKVQAAAIARRLQCEEIDAVYTSPLDRARETAACLAPATRVSDAMTEVDFGDWTGRSFTSLAADPQWQRWNVERSATRPPGGESMSEVQARAIREIRWLGKQHAGDRLVVVSHCEIIRAALMAWLGMPLDNWPRLEISPASISVLVVWPTNEHESSWGGKVLRVNETLAS